MTPDNFGRIAAQTAKQVILQRIREAEREMMYDEYIDRVGEVVTGIVQQTGDRRNILVDLGKVEALLPRPEQVDGERYEQGSRIKAVISEVRTGTKGPQVILSRRDPELIKTLFELEVPEIADGLVEIRGVAREPGYRSKIAVESHAQGVDPVGACVGPRGSRVRMVVSELRGEKIDIIPWNHEPARFVAKALSPARVREVYLDDEGKEATVVVPDDQLALAIGKEGMNARLAAPPDRLEDRHHQRHRVRAAGGRRGLRRRRARRRERLLRPLRGGALERQALPERRAARLEVLRRARRTRSSRCTSPTTRTTRSSQESEPELEALSDTRRARGGHRGRGRVRRCPSPRSSRPAPATRRSPAPTRRSRPAAARRVARRGRPATAAFRSSTSRRGRRREETSSAARSGPAPAAAARRPRPSSSASTRSAASSSPGAGAGRGVYTCRRLACFERARARRGVQPHPAANRPRRPGLSRVSTLGT